MRQSPQQMGSPVVLFRRGEDEGCPNYDYVWLPREPRVGWIDTGIGEWTELMAGSSKKSPLLLVAKVQ